MMLLWGRGGHLIPEDPRSSVPVIKEKQAFDIGHRVLLEKGSEMKGPIF